MWNKETNQAHIRIFTMRAIKFIYGHEPHYQNVNHHPDGERLYNQRHQIPPRKSITASSVHSPEGDLVIAIKIDIMKVT